MGKLTRGALVLVLGILSFTGFSLLTGIPAWIVGNRTLRDYREGKCEASELGIVQAGRLLGVINTSISVVALVAAMIFLVPAYLVQRQMNDEIVNSLDKALQESFQDSATSSEHKSSKAQPTKK